MLKRNAKNVIKNWIEHGKNAFLVSGARQVGKTYLIRECLKNSGFDHVEINLINQPEMVSVLKNSKSANDLKINISVAMGHTIKEGETIIFIDEVQEYKDFVTRIKFLVEENSFRYILSGSLLGIELTDLRSAPVGYLDEVQMFPLDFPEFLTASGVKDEVINYLKDCFEKREAVSEIVHNKIMDHFRRYLVVGGMPAAVAEYVESGDMNKISEIQKNIISQYDRDFTKYEKEEKKLMIRAVYDQIPSELLRQNRRFNYADIKKGLKFSKVEDSFIWLKSAGVIISVFNATEPRVALDQNRKSSLVKQYYSDVGLLCEKYGSAVKLKILMNEGVINQGGIYENAVAQQLTSNGFDIYYYNNNRLGELDLVVEYKTDILPIEVKSGKDYYVHSALNNVLGNEEYRIPEGLVLANSNIEVKGKVLYAPVYMCSFLKKEGELPILELD